MNDNKDQFSEKKPLPENTVSSSDTDEDAISDSEKELGSPPRHCSSEHTSEAIPSKENSKTKGTNSTPTNSPTKIFMSRWENQQEKESITVVEEQNKSIETKTDSSNLDADSTKRGSDIENKDANLKNSENTGPKTKDINPTPTYSPTKMFKSRWKTQKEAESSIASEEPNKYIETKTDISNLDPESTETDSSFDNKDANLKNTESTKECSFCDDIQETCSGKNQQQISCSTFDALQKQENTTTETENTDFIFASVHDPDREYNLNSSEITNTVPEPESSELGDSEKKSSGRDEENVVTDSVIQQIRESVIRHTDQYFQSGEFEKNKTEKISSLIYGDFSAVEQSQLECSSSKTNDDGFVHVETLKQNQEDLHIISPINTDQKSESDETKEWEKEKNSSHISQEDYAVPGTSRLPSCSVCFKEFDDEYLLNQHNASHHSSRSKSVPSDDCEESSNAQLSPKSITSVNFEESEHKSGNCEKTSVLKEILRAHFLSRSEEKQFTCEKCGNIYTCAKLYKKHEKKCKASVEDLPHKCDKCPKKFKYKGKLARHYLGHTGEKPFSCKICGKRFNIKYNRNKHAKKCEILAKRVYKCPDCPRSFLRKGNLTRHLRGHLKDKPHKCKKCGKRFSDPKDLKEHFKVCRPGSLPK